MQKGIDKINLVAGFAIDFAMLNIDVLADKRVTLKESLSYVTTALQIPEIIKSIGELQLEIDDLDSQEEDLVLIKIGEKLKEYDKEAISEIYEAFKVWYKATKDVVITLKKYSKKSNK